MNECDISVSIVNYESLNYENQLHRFQSIMCFFMFLLLIMNAQLVLLFLRVVREDHK